MKEDVEEASLSSFAEGGTTIVFGATGGLGQALCEALKESGQFAHVLALSRSSVPPIELEDEGSIEKGARFAATFGDVDLILDATGFLHDIGLMPEKTWRDLDPDHMTRAFAVNAIGPALLMKHFLPLLPSSRRAVFATLSARVGSIGDNRLGGWYGYRASKAALNQLVRTAAIELKRLRPQAICVALHPGTVDTPLSQPFARAGLEIKAPPEAASQLLSVIDRLELEDTGDFFDWRGDPMPW